ncbi:MAG: hypothetical protein DRH30_00530 [Deltaproteobacteria bacterium]|nr:MAG: hypothetical protein DRH30_00530 [Deltaproteobacteria bacterium]
MNDEERLYLWVRVIGFAVLITTVALAALALVIVPIFDHDYRVDSAAIIAIVGTLSASALALVEVTVRLKRNNFPIIGGKKEERKEGEE